MLSFPHISWWLGIICISFHPRRNISRRVTIFIFHPRRRVRALCTWLIIFHPSRLIASGIRLILCIFGPSRSICGIIFSPRRLISILYCVLIIFCPRRLVIRFYIIFCPRWLISWLSWFILNYTFISPRWLLRRIAIIFNPTRWVSFLRKLIDRTIVIVLGSKWSTFGGLVGFKFIIFFHGFY